MKKDNLITAIEFCANHNIEILFINSLQESGLIKIKTINETVYIHERQLQELEKIVHLYYELDINLEGIETITYLLDRTNVMQSEITTLRNRLRLYEDI